MIVIVHEGTNIDPPLYFPQSIIGIRLNSTILGLELSNPRLQGISEILIRRYLM